MKTITWVDLCLDKWLYYWGDYIPSEDVSMYIMLDYIRDMYEDGIQYAVRYY